MMLTNKIDFKPTKKRFTMMSSSSSIVRLIPITLAVISVTSLLSVAFCTDVFDGHPMEIYEGDITLIPVWENQSPKGYYWTTWTDSDGTPYTGEQVWLFRINDQVARKHYFENGKETLVEIFNEQEELVFLGLSEFTEDEIGVKYLKHYQKIDSSDQFLAFEAKWDQNIHTVKEYFQSGQLNYEFSFNTEINKYEGLFSFMTNRAIY